MVKELREMTGAGMMECKKALVECDGDMEKAVDVLRTRGLAAAAKKAGRATHEGTVMTVVADDAKSAAVVELNCETDFVARTDEFQKLGPEIAMQIAAANPLYVSPEEVPAGDLEREKEVYRNQALEEGKPAHIVDKIAEGRVNKFYEETCLLEQNYIRDPDRKIKDMVIDNIAKMGENIVVRRFARYSIGE